MLLSTCLDFWITKNVTGRYLIGLRWWSASDISSEEDLEKDEERATAGEEDSGWYFESYDVEVNNSMIDTNVFWFSQAGAAIFWCIFLVLKTLGLSLFWVGRFDEGDADVHMRQSIIDESVRVLQVQRR